MPCNGSCHACVSQAAVAYRTGLEALSPLFSALIASRQQRIVTAALLLVGRERWARHLELPLASTG
eukprot:15435056-Alexandrium_andersonii.AAC.1